jgi:hypothetical protein
MFRRDSKNFTPQAGNEQEEAEETEGFAGSVIYSSFTHLLTIQ